jgi:DNA-binding CsgD family transcriptional regulator
LASLLTRINRFWKIEVPRLIFPNISHMGRPPSLTPQQQKEARRRAQGETLIELAKSYNVGKSTISRLGP